ncbi:MAG: histidine--tRNA ligase, partial [Oscillospiraceae bacterium]|nr:histidine--tRNA ligase [Oscillospiraceae bacterium]
EASEILLAKGGGETEKQIYRFTKGEHDLSLRFDLTVPLAKYVAMNYGQLTFPFRRYQIGKVYRGERAQRGRFREFYQCDIDVVGDGKLDVLNEAEIPSVIYNAFTALGFRGFTIHFNNRKVLSGLFAILGVSENAAKNMQILDKLGKIGADKVRELLITEAETPPDAADTLVGLITAPGDPLETLAAYSGRSAVFDEGLSELRQVAAHLSAFGVPDTHAKIDLTISRGLDYYTGTVYETFLTAHPEIGSVCSGGRYDNLAAYYTDKKLPGVGISIGLTRLFYVLSEQGYLNGDVLTAPADLLIIPMTDDLSHAVTLATSLRAAGLRTQIYGEDRKFKAKLAYADKLGIPFAAFLGEDEIKAGKVTVKDLATGEQTTASAAVLAEGVRKKLAVRRDAPPIKDV